MSKFSKSERVVNYAITQNVTLEAAIIEAKQCLNITLTAQESEQAWLMFDHYEHAKRNNMPAKRGLYANTARN